LYFSSVLNRSLIISGKTSIGPTHSTPCAILSKHWFFFFLTIVFVCLSLAVSDYRQSLQFQNLNKEKQNIQLEVCNKVMKIFYCLFFYLLAFGVWRNGNIWNCCRSWEVVELWKSQYLIL
jgi:hypothetical protein